MSTDSRDPTFAGAGAQRDATPPADREDELAPGARVGEYVVVSLLSGGGHGNVYLAEHRLLGRRAALKVMHRRVAAQETMVSRFVREARIVNQIRHPNIVDIYDLGTLPDERPYCVMELLPGSSLRDLVAARGRLAPAEALAILEPVCGALDAAHAASVVHRDVKASNVIVDEGPPLAVKLIDFGVAKMEVAGERGLTAVGERLGTGACMSPEQILGRPVDARTDVYALGVLLYQIVTGELPYRARDPLEMERLHLSAPTPRASASAPVAPSVDAVIDRAMAKTPRERFPSTRDFLAALRAAVGAAGPAGRRVAAVAVHASIAPRVGEREEELLAAAEAVADVEARLREAGFLVPVATPEAVTAVRPLPPDPGAALASRAAASALARELAGTAATASGTLRVRVAVHAGEALVRSGPAGDEIAGGSACEAPSWPEGGEGVLVTPAAAAALDGG